MIPLLIIAAIGGDSAGFWMGRYFGRWIENQKESFFFKKHHLEKAEVFYSKHGSKTIVLARFMPFIRTFAPIVAGMAKMNYSTFVSFNILGGILWVTLISLLGFFLGRVIPNVEKYLYPIIGAIVVASLIPIVIHWYQEKTSYAHMHPKASKPQLFLHRLLSRLKSR